ncbi:MAG: hypothetical protein GFH24_608434n52 [Chloroflexi bacterium AL-N5]|nr:hypothetical protein [Chloroflexi bacterium AL-N5]
METRAAIDTLELINKLNQEAWDKRNEDPLTARNLSEQSFILAQDEQYTSGVAYSLITQGYAQLRNGHYQVALRLSKKALKHFENLNDPTGIQRSLNTLTLIYGHMGNLPTALKYGLQTLKHCEAHSDNEATAHAINNLAIIYVELGDYTNALEYHLRGLALYEKLDSHQGVMRAVLNVGVVFFELGNISEALEYFQKSLQLSESHDAALIHAMTLGNIGRCYAKEKHYDKALNTMQNALQRMDKLDHKPGICDNLAELGTLYTELEDYQEAQRVLERSLKLRQSLEDRKGQAENHRALGKLFLRTGVYERAVRMFSTCLVQAEEVGAKSLIYKAHQGLAQAAKCMGHFETALYHLEKYVSSKDQVFNETSDQRLQALQVSYEVEQTEKEKEIYRLKSVELAQMNDELQRLTEELERQTREDPLTKLNNRRLFDAVLERSFAESMKKPQPMSVMICDIDNFKRVNDSFSHQIGDEVLVAVANIFRSNLRDSDTVARYGGEEFVMLLPNTSAKEAYGICDRLRQVIESHPWEQIHPKLKITMSMGICDDLSLGHGETMIARADDKLYEAKHHGKNQVRVWSAEDKADAAIGC